MEAIWRKITASAVQQKREEVCASLRYAASFYCLLEEWHECEEPKPKPKAKVGFFVDRKVGAEPHHTEWCAATSRYRCLRCGKTVRR